MDGLEGREPHVERDLTSLDTARAEFLEYPLGEMEAGSRCRDRSTGLGIDGLIGLPIRGVIRPVNVGWQGHMADAVDSLLDWPVWRAQADAAHPVRCASQHLGLQGSIAENQDFSGAHLASRADQSLPGVVAFLAREQEFDLAGQKLAPSRVVLSHPLRLHSPPMAEKARGKHFGVVENQQVAAPEDLRNLAKG